MNITYVAWNPNDTYLYSYIYIIHLHTRDVQGGEDPQDALSVYVIFHNLTLWLMALFPKINGSFAKSDLQRRRHAMGLRHTVSWWMIDIKKNRYYE